MTPRNNSLNLRCPQDRIDIFEVMDKHMVEVVSKTKDELVIRSQGDTSRTDHAAYSIDLQTEVWFCRTCGTTGNALELDVALSLARQPLGSCDEAGVQAQVAPRSCRGYQPHRSDYSQATIDNRDEAAAASAMEQLDEAAANAHANDITLAEFTAFYEGLRRKYWFSRPLPRCVANEADTRETA